jgi:hypothetical protein
MAADLTYPRAGRANCIMCAVLMALVIGAISPWTLAAADAVAAPALKAAFLFNFAKFADWPADALAPGQRLTMCVLGDNAVANALEHTIQGRAVGGHELTVQIVKPDEPLRACHLLYVGGRDGKRSREIFDMLRGAAVFAIGESDKFAETGGIAQLIVENDRIRFAVNQASVQRARLSVSSKLLSLATIVKDEYDAQR